MAKGKGPGRPAFEPNDDQRYGVKVMKLRGMDGDAIARVLGITKPTLYKHFKYELEDGKQELLTAVTESLYRQALAGNVGAAAFILKAQDGWREKQDIELSGKDGGPIEISDAKSRLLEKLSDGAAR